MIDIPWRDDNDEKEIRPRQTIYEILQSQVIKVELGGGSRPVGGHLNVDVKDIPEVDYVADITTLDDFPDGAIDAILARDVIQCFHREELVTILRRWYRKLKRSSRIVFQVPDMKQIFNLYLTNRVCRCWDSSTKRADPDCTKCKGEAILSYDKFNNYLFGRNRPYEMYKSAYDMEDLSAIVEKAGFTIMDTQTKDLRIVIVAKKVRKQEAS